MTRFRCFVHIIFYVNSMSFEPMQEIDVSNTALRNYFQNKIIEKEPKLILKQKTKNIDSYSRLCQSNQRRQPVILTKEELQDIQEKYPEYKKHENYLEYGTNPDNPYYYICPKYWNIKTGTPISEIEMNKNKLHKYIIPQNAKNVPANAYIYEFVNDKKVHYPYPNFIPDRHPDGYYLPCCFQDYDTAKRRKVREEVERQQNEYRNQKQKQMNVAIEEEKEELPIEKGKKKKMLNQKPSSAVPLPLPQIKKVSETESTEYVKGPDKFPLNVGRWGQLPVSIQTLLEHDNNACQISNTNMKIKQNHPCLLRHGVHNSERQSFLECIADIVERPSVSSLIDEITDNVDLDLFMLVQNGNLVEEFYNEDTMIDVKGMKLFKISNFYKKLDNHNEDEMNLFKKVCKSYINFTKYLRNPDSYIDYAHLWDIICVIYQFKLCIFEITNNDITDNVEILCPSNHYSNDFLYSTEDQMVMIVKKGDYYEPIYMYKKLKNGEIEVEKYFSSKSAYFKSVTKILKRIFTFMKKECSPKNLFKIKQSPTLYSLIDVLNKHNYKLQSQVINYTSKVIGVLVENKYGLLGYIPCHPSGLLYKDLINRKEKMPEEIFMFTDMDIYNSYADTLSFYQDLCLTMNKHLPCRLIYKIVEDEHMVGFLTESDQLVPINPPIPVVETYGDELPIYESFIPSPGIEKELIMTTAVDDARSRYINEVKTESAQYFMFRNIIKLLLKTSVNNKLVVSELIRDKDMDTLVDMLKDITEDKIIFVDKKQLPITLSDISFKNNEPIYLLKNKNNQHRYYLRLADELVRNSRLQKYIMFDISPIILKKDDYEINSDEIMLNESMLLDYYDSLEGNKKLNVNKYKSYDNVDPYNYKELVEKDDYKFYKSEEKNSECIVSTYSIPTKYLKTIFDPKSNAMNSYNCGTGIISAMIPGIADIEIRNALIAQYNSYSRYMPNILKVLNFQGKKKLIEEIETTKHPLKSIILSQDYFLTSLDIWMLCLYYKLPTIFVSLKDAKSSNLMETFYNEKMFLAYGSKNDNFYVIGIPGHTIAKKPITLFSRILSVEAIENNVNPHLYSIGNLLSRTLVEKCFNMEIDIETFLEHFERPKKKAKSKDDISDEE
jgi:hypothetical protein